MELPKLIRLSVFWGTLLGAMAGAFLPILNLFTQIITVPYFSQNPISFAAMELSNNISYLIFGTLSSSLLGGSLGLILGATYGVLGEFILSIIGEQFVVTVLTCLCFSIISMCVVYTSVNTVEKIYSVSENWQPDLTGFIGGVLGLVFTIFGFFIVFKQLKK